MSYRAARLQGEALTESSTAPALSALLTTPPLDGDLLVKGAEGWEGAQGAPAARDTLAGEILSSAAASIADPDITISVTREVAFSISTANSLVTDGVTYGGGSYGADWATDFTLGSAATWLITAHLVTGFRGTPATTEFLRISLTNDLDGTVFAPSTFGPMLNYQMRGRTSIYAAVITTTGATTLRFGALAVGTSSKNIAPSLATLQSLSILRMA